MTQSMRVSCRAPLHGDDLALTNPLRKPVNLGRSLLTIIAGFFWTPLALRLQLIERFEQSSSTSDAVGSKAR